MARDLFAEFGAEQEPQGRDLFEELDLNTETGAGGGAMPTPKQNFFSRLWAGLTEVPDPQMAEQYQGEQGGEGMGIGEYGKTVGQTAANVGMGAVSFPASMLAGVGGIVQGKGVQGAREAQERVAKYFTPNVGELTPTAQETLEATGKVLGAPREVAGQFGEYIGGEKGRFAGEMAADAVMMAAPFAYKAVKNSTWYRSLSVPQRDLVVLTMDDFLKRGWTEAQVLRQMNVPTFRQEIMRTRPTEQPMVTPEPHPVAPTGRLMEPSGMKLPEPAFSVQDRMGLTAGAYPGRMAGPVDLFSPEFAAGVQQAGQPALPPGQGFELGEGTGPRRVVEMGQDIPYAPAPEIRGVGGPGEVETLVQGGPPAGYQPSKIAPYEPTPVPESRFVFEDEIQEREAAKKSFNEAWQRAYGGRPDTAPADLPPKKPFTEQPVLTKEEAQKIAKMTDEELANYNQKAVKQALSEGKPVPPEVLADYPDLAPAKAKEPWEMTVEERQAEIQRLKDENKAALATPLMSEGGIGPGDFGKLSNKQREKRLNNAMKRMDIEAQIRKLEKTDDKLLSEHNEKLLKEADSRLTQIQSTNKFIERAGQGKKGLKPSAKKEIDKQLAEAGNILAKFPELSEKYPDLATTARPPVAEATFADLEPPVPQRAQSLNREKIIQGLKEKEFYGTIDRLERGKITLEDAALELGGGKPKVLPKLITIDPYEFASQMKLQGVDRKESWSRWIQRTSLKPGMDAKDWYKIYDSVSSARAQSFPQSQLAGGVSPGERGPSRTPDFPRSALEGGFAPGGRRFLKEEGHRPLEPKEISEVAKYLDYGAGKGGEKDAINYLKSKGKKYIDGYHVSSLDGLEFIKNNGIKTTGGYFKNPDAVYFFADADDIGNSAPFLATKFEGTGKGVVGVTHFRIPIEKLKNMHWDGRFAAEMEAYSSFMIKEDIPQKYIIEQRKYELPSGEDYQKGRRGSFVENTSPQTFPASDLVNNLPKGQKRMPDFPDPMGRMEKRNYPGYDPLPIKQRQLGKREEGRYAPAVTEQEMAKVRSLPELPKKKIFGGGKLDISAEPTAFTFDKLGQDAKELFQIPVRKADHQVVKDQFEWKAEIAKMKKDLPKGSGERIGKYMIALDPKGREILKRMGIEIIDATKLTEAEKNVVRWWNKKAEDYFVKINAVREEVGLEPMNRRENYITFLRDLDAMAEAGIPVDKPGAATEALDNLHLRTMPFGFAQARTKAIYPLKTDFFQIAQKYGDTAIRFINMTPPVAKGREMIGSYDTWNPKAEKSDKWSMRDTQPETFNFLQGYLDAASGTEGHILPPKVEKVLRTLRKNITGATLSANTRSAIVQVTSLKEAGVQLGPKYFAKGLGRWLNREGETALEQSKVLAGREMDVSVREIMEASGKSVPMTGWQQAPAKAVEGLSKGKRALTKVGFLPLRMLDQQVARITWLGAEAKGKAMGLEGDNLINYADDVVVETQSSGNPIEISPIQRTELGRMFTVFQNFTINRYNFVKNNLLGVGTGKGVAWPKLLGYLLTLEAVGVVFEDLLNTTSPDPSIIGTAVRSTKEGKNPALSVGRDLVEQLPGMSGLRYGSGMGGALVDYTRDIATFFSDKPDWQKKAALELIAKGAGVPGTAQIAKTKRGMDRGKEWWDAMWLTEKRSMKPKRGGVQVVR